MSDRATATALLSPATLEHAGENWARPPPVVEKQARGGRPPKRAKYPRCRSQEQRAFAAGILHSAMLYEGLRASLHEICAMLLVRGFIDAQRVSAVLRQHGAANCTGVRPGEEVVVSDQTVLDWLDANVSTRSRYTVNEAGEQRLRLPDDAVGTGRGGDTAPALRVSRAAYRVGAAVGRPETGATLARQGGWLWCLRHHLDPSGRAD